MFVKNSQETVRTCLNRTRTLTKAEKEKREKCGNGTLLPGMRRPDPYDVRANSHIWRGQRPVIVTLPVIGPKCGQIYRGKFKM